MPYANPKLLELYQRSIRNLPWRRAQTRAAANRWRAANIEYTRAKDCHRMAMKRGKQVPWAQIEEIAEIYALAAFASKFFGKPYEVDHIVPVNSELVCGLHVVANLEVVARHENRSKSNKAWPDMP